MTTKLSAFRAFLVLTMAIGFCSYVVAGPHGDHDRGQARSGAGSNSNNNASVLGGNARDEHSDFFNKESNPGTQASAFGRETSSQARMRERESTRKEVNSDFNRNNTPDPKSFFNARSEQAPACSPVANRRAEFVATPPDPLPRAIPGNSVCPVPSAIPHNPFSALLPFSNLFSHIRRHPSNGGLFPPLPSIPPHAFPKFSPIPAPPPGGPRPPPSFPSPIPSPSPVDR